MDAVTAYAGESGCGTQGHSVRARLRYRAMRRERAPAATAPPTPSASPWAALAVAHEAGVRRRATGSRAYESTPSSRPPRRLIAALVARGIRVMVPVTLPDWTWTGARRATARTPLGHGRDRPGRGGLRPRARGDGRGTRHRAGQGLLRPGAPPAPAAPRSPWSTRGRCVDEPLPREPHDRPVDAVIAAGGSGCGTGCSRQAAGETG